MAEDENREECPQWCDRCATPLTPGDGSFFVVQIEAFADPTPPTFSADDLCRDTRATIRRLAAQSQAKSPQEAMDEIHRRLTLYLCRPCFRDWIEAPAGQPPAQSD